MIDVTERTFGRLPHTNKQLARGAIGLTVCGAVAILSGVLIRLLDAPVWVEGSLGALALVSLSIAALAPLWYWFVEPFYRGCENA